jgi:hypothetical protein
MSEPAVDIEESANNWKSYADWPIPGTQMTDIFLRNDGAVQGSLGGSSGGSADATTFRDANLSENNHLSLTGSQANKRMFLSPPLKTPLTFTVTVNGAQTAGGTVPATLSLTLGAPATFGTFTPGVAKDYTATTSANIVSTAGDASLSVNDPGRMTNGAFALPQPLQVSFSKSAWSAPTSNESVTITFKQPIGAHDPLRTGTYSRTLTFTLSTTNP